MISPATLHRWAYALLFAAIAALVVFLRILPTGGSAGGWPPPDFIVLAGFAWVAQRPDFVPVLLFAALLVVTELLFLRPPGVASGLAVIGLEAIRARAGLLRERGFLTEWITVGVILALMLVAERIAACGLLRRPAEFRAGRARDISSISSLIRRSRRCRSGACGSAGWRPANMQARCAWYETVSS